MITREFKPEGVGGIVFEMIPYRTIKVDMVIADIDRIIPAEERNTYQNMFIHLEGCTQAIRFGDDLPLEWQGLRDYWQGRTRSTVNNFDRFFDLISTDVMFVWWEAWRATRDVSIAAPPELSKEAETSDDPNSVSDVPEPSPTLKPNGSTRPLKSLAEQAGLMLAS